MEFLRYPQFIRYHFNGSRFGPPWSFTSTSTWPWVGHTVSGRIQLTSYALFRLALATAPHLKCLTLLHIVTRWPVLQKVRGHTSNVLPQLVSAGFQVLFHSPPGVLFTFPSRYYALSVANQCLALEGGPPCFPQNSSCSAVLWIPVSPLCLSPT